jgi:isopentenyl-diphosphate delta-isomerase
MTPDFDDKLDEPVQLVDAQDRPAGTATKWDAHRQGLLHRGFSLLVFNESDELLLQKRADGKYHSAGLWTNTCCSHPYIGEAVEDAIHRRLEEEMGFDCPATFIDTLHYTTPPLENGLMENELIHLYAGRTNRRSFSPDPLEVADWRWITSAGLKREIASAPGRFSYWMRVYLMRFDLDFLTQRTG